MKFILNKDTLEVDEAAVGNSGSVNYYEAEVKYDESWNNLNIEAIIVKRKKGGGCEDTGTGTSVAVINNKFFIDKKLSGDYYIGFVGYTIENDKKIYQISSTLKYIYFKKGAGEIETENEELPTPTEWEIYISQIKSIVSDIEGLTDRLNIKVAEVEKKLEDGDFNGKDGKDGKDGINGTNGVDGKSAYEIWLEQGNEGIEEDFLNSLQGRDGKDGIDGQNGTNGQDGQDGYTPQKGKDYWTDADKQEIITDLKENNNFVEDSNYTHTDNNFSNEEKEKLSSLENYDDTVVKEEINNLKTNKQDTLILGNNIIIKDGVISAKEKTWKKVRTITIPSDDYKGQEIDGVRYDYSVSSNGGIKSITFSTDEDGEPLSEHSVTGAIIRLTPTENININQGFVSINSNGLSASAGYALDYILNIKATTTLRWFEYSLQPYYATMITDNPGRYRFPMQYTQKQINDFNFGGFEATSVLGEGTKLEIWMYGYWD